MKHILVALFVLSLLVPVSTARADLVWDRHSGSQWNQGTK